DAQASLDLAREWRDRLAEGKPAALFTPGLGGVKTPLGGYNVYAPRAGRARGKFGLYPPRFAKILAAPGPAGRAMTGRLLEMANQGARIVAERDRLAITADGGGAA